MIGIARVHGSHIKIQCKRCGHPRPRLVALNKERNLQASGSDPWDLDNAYTDPCPLDGGNSDPKARRNETAKTSGGMYRINNQPHSSVLTDTSCEDRP